jgi:hypothetical protein
MFKRTIWGCVAATLLGMLTLGPTWVWNHLRSTGQQAREKLEQEMPDDQVEALIRLHLSDLDRQIRSYHDSLGKAADEVGRAEVKKEDLDRQLAAEKTILTRAKELLDQHQDHYPVAGKTYSRVEIQADSQARLAQCQTLENKIAAQGRIIKELRKGLADGRGNLAQAQRLKAEAMAELDSLKVRLANARVRKDLSELTAVLRKAPFGPDSELARQMAQLQDRVRNAERHADFQAEEAKGGAIVDWQGGAPAEDVGQAITRYLKSTPAAPAP